MERSDLYEKLALTLNCALDSLENNDHSSSANPETLFYNYVYNKLGKKQTANNYRWAISIEEFVSYLKTNYHIESIYEVIDPTIVLKIREEIIDAPYNKKNKNSTSASLAQYADFLRDKCEQSMHLVDLVENDNLLDLLDEPLQIIYYGAPGTGKSHEVDDKTKNLFNKFVYRTTFHPDSDYSTFVGSYKPTMDAGKIIYTFVTQAFLKAYLKAWQNPTVPVILVIEEINRGNCAQIFGDLFQLLDRQENGYSTYPIEADTDIQKIICEKFQGGDYELTESIKLDENVVTGYTSNYGKTLSEDIQNGNILLLPKNLYIWATMNTSDQSLFPIDSAFKRRWDWKYVPIQDGGKKWGIKVAGLEYDWWSFLEEINELIDTTTSSEDKKLGYFFCKPDDDKSVTADKFVNKVIFYLWNDVFKDYDMSHEAFKDENKGLAFGKFFKNDGNVNENVVMTFLDKLRVSLKGSYDSDEEEDMANLTQDEKNRNDSTQAEKWKNFWQLFNESDLHKRGFNSAMGYVRGIVINDTTILIELPRNSKSPHTNTIKFVAQFDQHSLPTLELPNNEDNILWIQKTTADKDRIELRLTDVNFDNLIEKANNDLFERLSKQLDEFVKFIDEKVPRSNNK